MAGDHGVVADGVSAYPQEVTVQMVANFVAGGASINALARQVGAQVVIVDMGVAGDLSSLGSAVLDRKIAPGTNSIARGPAMTREQAIAAVEAGIGVALELGPSTDVFGTGEMGIGNTTPSSAIVAAVTGAAAVEVTGRGTGIDDAQLGHKAAMVEQSLRVNAADVTDGLDLLAKLGGYEIGGIAGLILGRGLDAQACRRRRVHLNRRRAGGSGPLPVLDRVHDRGSSQRGVRSPSSPWRSSARSRCSTWTCAWARAPAPLLP